MSSKGAKRSRRVSGESDVADGGEAAQRGVRAASAASASSSTAGAALVLSRRPSASEIAPHAGAAGGTLAVGITALEMGRFVEEQLRGLRREAADVRAELAAARSDHAWELAAVHCSLSRLASDHARELAAVRSDHASLAGELADARYETSRRFVLLDSRAATTEIGLVCRRGGTGPDGYNEYRSVLSVLFGFQEFDDLKDGLMRFFTTKEACELRLVHSEFLDAVAATPWYDQKTVIKGSVAAWRACFPSAQAANVRGRKDLANADFVHLRGLRFLDMSECLGVSDTAFVNLRGIETLVMQLCTQGSVSSAAIEHLQGIQT